MSFETFIARRYLHSGKFFTSVATWITIAGVILGVGVVCFVISMHNGFESEIRSRLLGTTSHITIFPPYGSDFSNYYELVDEVEAIDGVVAASPFIYYKAAISSASSGDGIIVRGIDLEKERLTSNVENDLKVGEYSCESIVLGDDTIPGILMGSNLAEGLGVYLGESVVLYSLKGEDLQKRTRPRIAKFYVSGIFETGLYEFDGQMVYISLESAQKLFRTGNTATGVHLKLTDIYNAAAMTTVIDSSLGYQYDVVPWNILHKNLFTWIAIEKLALFVGFILIVLVAAFSIISTLVMLTMEKRSEIGILKTIGSTPWSIAKIFILKGLSIGAMGVFGGWLLALVATWLQNEYQIVSLPPDIYFISYLPVDPHLLDFMIAGALTFVICFLAALYPAWQAARLSVVDVLRQ